MKFKFKLESVKKHRQILKDLAQKEFEIARLRVDEKLAQINGMYEAIDNARILADKKIAEAGAKAAPFMQIEDFINGQSIRIQNAKLEVRELMAVLEEKQEALLERVKEFKIIEKLEEKQRQDFKIEMNRKAQIQADDMSIMRFRRNRESA